MGLGERMFYSWGMADQLFELRRRTFDTPHFRGMTFIETEAKTILNKVPGNYLPFNWTINPYRGCSHRCSFCFARASHTYLDMNAGPDWGTKIVVKVNAPDLLRSELRKKRWKGESIAMGTNTDPYQRCEGKYKLMSRILETLIEYRNPFSILTRGTLMLRDLDLLVEAGEVTDVSTSYSVPTLDDDAWRRSEPGTPHPRKRLEAVKRLNEAGVPCGVLVAPILPGITDRPEQLREVVEAAIDAGATHVSPILLHLRPKVKEVYLEWLTNEYPDLVPRYEEMYARSAYASSRDKDELSKVVRDLVANAGGIRFSSRRNGQPRWRAELRKQKAMLSTEQMKLL